MVKLSNLVVCLKDLNREVYYLGSEIFFLLFCRSKLGFCFFNIILFIFFLVFLSCVLLSFVFGISKYVIKKIFKKLNCVCEILIVENGFIFRVCILM